MKADWISPWWQAALLPDEWDVCGVIVPSLSVWHTFALENIGNQYLCGGACDKDDAASLLMFASLDMQDGRQLLMPHRQFLRRRHLKKMWRRLRKKKWDNIDAACDEYVKSCMRTVSRWSKGGGSRESLLLRSMPQEKLPLITERSWMPAGSRPANSPIFRTR